LMTYRAREPEQNTQQIDHVMRGPDHRQRSPYQFTDTTREPVCWSRLMTLKSAQGARTREMPRWARMRRGEREQVNGGTGSKEMKGRGNEDLVSRPHEEPNDSDRCNSRDNIRPTDPQCRQAQRLYPDPELVRCRDRQRGSAYATLYRVSCCRYPRHCRRTVCSRFANRRSENASSRRALHRERGPVAHPTACERGSMRSPRGPCSGWLTAAGRQSETGDWSLELVVHAPAEPTGGHQTRVR